VIRPGPVSQKRSVQILSHRVRHDKFVSIDSHDSTNVISRRGIVQKVGRSRERNFERDG